MCKAVDRWTWYVDGGGFDDHSYMGKELDGDYVSYEDYKVLLDECDSLRGVLKNMGYSPMSELKRYMVPSGHGIEEHKAGSLYRKEQVDALVADRHEEIARLRAALEMWVVAYDNLTMKSGVCCCGDDMENHDNAMNCGHSPVDCGEEYAASAIVKTIAALEDNL